MLLVAPASANSIAKLAWGLADDMLSTTALAMSGPVLVAPAMNVRMYNQPVVQDNLARLREEDYYPPGERLSGLRRCGDRKAGVRGCAAQLYFEGDRMQKGSVRDARACDSRAHEGAA